MKKLLTALLLAAALLMLPAVSLAAAAPQMWVSPDGQKGVDAIAWYKQNNSHYYLFLPANWQGENARFGLTGIKKFVFNETGVDIQSGSDASFLQPGDYSVTVDGNKRTLHVMQGSPGFPALYITTASGSLNYIQKNKNNKEEGALIFVGPDGKTQYNGTLEHIKCRGNSSMTFVKKSYQIKLATGTNLMGMGKCKKWILTGNYRDKSLLRNQIVYDTAMELHMPYTPEHISAEVYINNEYQGVYLFSEKVMIDDDRIDIADLEDATEQLNKKPLSSYPMIGKDTSAKGKYKA